LDNKSKFAAPGELTVERLLII